ncbi:uncharacterized protein [Drosophila virilis]|uniref:Uncharacterized protein n=1 Tax=Drosophila virilis TaxID=7244 RepID=B4MDC9_DROVI|nr:uncharacterized protein LOC6635613 [Drosophila virilis]EDW71190.1 uncharacterized protein Dvir_GJ16221 [Drosophila virilis]
MAVKHLTRTQKKHKQCPTNINSAHKKLIPKYAKSNNKVLCQQQRILKQNFRNTSKRLELPTVHRVWRKTIVRIKPKPRNLVPRLFRVDRLTGLPLDYERTVSRIMHYVNPHIFDDPSPEEQMERLLTRALGGIIDNCSNRCPYYLRNQMRTFLRSQGSKSTRRTEGTDNEDLSQFYCACKRGPIILEQAPTYRSKFNYNSLKINTK